MRIAFFVDTSAYKNWGSQATSTALKTLIASRHPLAEIVPLKLAPLPYRHFKPALRRLNQALGRAILADDSARVLALLERMNVPRHQLEGYDQVYFNGEGIVHQHSGHLFRLLGMLAAMKTLGARVWAVNQTVDVIPDSLAGRTIRKVFGAVDFLAVREPRSARLLESMGLRPRVVADAVYALPRLDPARIAQTVAALGLPPEYVCVTGSSALGRGPLSLHRFDRMIRLIRRHYPLPVVLLANTKTDLFLARWVSRLRGDSRIIDFRHDHVTALAVIAGARLLVGGRQHPNIFAAMYGTPFIPLAGNTHKNAGVVELLNYPIDVLAWDAPAADILAAFSRADAQRERIRALPLPVVDAAAFDEGTA